MMFQRILKDSLTHSFGEEAKILQAAKKPKFCDAVRERINFVNASV